MPNNRRMDIERGHEGMRDTSDTREDLQTGPMPERIDRQGFANNMGFVGPRGNIGFPVFMDTIKVGHIPTYVKTRGVVPQPGNSWDDTAFIKAPQAGNPLP